MTSPGPDGPPPEAAPPRDPNQLVQMNVRLPLGLREQIDSRRQGLTTPLSRDKWVARALAWALTQPTPQPRTRRQLAGRTPTGRTMNNPTRGVPAGRMAPVDRDPAAPDRGL